MLLLRYQVPRLRQLARTTQASYTSRGFASQTPLRAASTARSKLLRVYEEVEHALQTGKPVVALETTIYTHGFPYPENVALAARLESLIRINGGVPATIGILNGVAHIGMDPEELIQLVSTAGSKDTWKISRRDLSFIAGLSGIRGQKLNGGTTISGTMVLAHLAGIKIFATGGLGGVHRGGENTMDVSADLTELGRTPVCVIGSGCKSFLDIPRTLEYLETQGVAVGTFADGRRGQVDFPAFFSRDSGVKSPQTIQTEADAAAIVHAQFSLPVHSGLFFGNPVPVESAMEKREIDAIIEKAVTEAMDMGITGAKNTPFVLKRIRELSNDASVVANRALVEANVIRGTKVAVELAKLEADEKTGLSRGFNPGTHPLELSAHEIRRDAIQQKEAKTVASRENDILVIGAIAADTSCDYNPFDESVSNTGPVLQTSNPASITQSAGGVGRNVATASQYAGAQVSLASVVARDLAGDMLVRNLQNANIDTAALKILDASPNIRTAQYVAVNDRRKDLVMAMGDFSIFSHPEFEDTDFWLQLIERQEARPKWIVTDGNWSEKVLSNILQAARTHNIPVAFEPVSTVKAARLFHASVDALSDVSVLPNNLLSLATPNQLELAAMHEAATQRELFQSQYWWELIDDFGLSSAGSRDKFVSLVGPQLADQGIPQQVIRLLPFIPNIVTKLGSQGSLLTMVLPKDDPRLNDPVASRHILSRSKREDGVVGGLYMRLFPPAETVPAADVVSVNGVGDTLLGVLMAGIIHELNAKRRPRLEEILPLAQKCAVMTLKSKESVSELIRERATTGRLFRPLDIS